MPSRAPSQRQVWWLHAARNGAEHAFEREARELLKQLPGGRRIVCYSRPASDDRGFDVAGRLTTAAVLHEAGVPIDAAVYLCGPAAFMHDISAALGGAAHAEVDHAKPQRGSG